VMFPAYSAMLPGGTIVAYGLFFALRGDFATHLLKSPAPPKLSRYRSLRN
jgi:hypothetical protein